MHLLFVRLDHNPTPTGDDIGLAAYQPTTVSDNRLPAYQPTSKDDIRLATYQATANRNNWRPKAWCQLSSFRNYTHPEKKMKTEMKTRDRLNYSLNQSADVETEYLADTWPRKSQSCRRQLQQHWLAPIKPPIFGEAPHECP